MLIRTAFVSTNNIGFYEEISKIIPYLSSNIIEYTLSFSSVYLVMCVLQLAAGMVLNLKKILFKNCFTTLSNPLEHFSNPILFYTINELFSKSTIYKNPALI